MFLERQQCEEKIQVPPAVLLRWIYILILLTGARSPVGEKHFRTTGLALASMGSASVLQVNHEPLQFA